tara:strand:+ start:7968 stop:8876 length:909 start_codon:yes stop_codon:yes gene_type:complete
LRAHFIAFFTVVLAVNILLSRPLWAYGVVTTIAPLQFIAQQVMKGVAEPTQIITGYHSPHHFQLKPSQRHAIAKADLVLYVSPSLESFLPAGHDDEKYIALIHTRGLILRSLPTSLGHKSLNHHPHSGVKAADPHIWLAPYNMKIMAQEISRILMEKDPAHAALYRQNSQSLIQQITKIEQNAADILDNMKKVAFVVEHPAYGYFEEQFDLHHIGHVKPTEDIPPSAKHIKDLQNMLRQTPVNCLIYDKSRPSRTSQALAARYNLKLISVDPLGRQLPLDGNYYTHLINRHVQAFSTCEQSL